MESSNERFLHIVEEIHNAVNDCFQYAARNNPNAFVLFLAKACWRGEPINRYLFDYMGYDYQDETRNNFYVQHLQMYYPTQIYDYCDDDNKGIYNLQIEMLIYSQLWESHPLLYKLVSLANICSGASYDWKLVVPDSKLFAYINEQIIAHLKDEGLKLGEIIEQCYNSNFRNALAHGLYSIDRDKQTIMLYNRDAIKTGKTTFTFYEFQSMFLHAVLLDNMMYKILNEYRKKFAEENVQMPPFPISDEDNRLIMVSAKQNPETKRVRFEGKIIGN